MYILEKVLLLLMFSLSAVKSIMDFSSQDNLHVEPPCLRLKLESASEPGSQRRRSLLYTPSCDLFGFFNAVQCSRTECWCVNKCGKEVPGSRVAGTGIKCGVAQFPCLRDAKSRFLPGNSCDKYGFYNAKQCDRSHCWCVDRCGNELHGTRVASWESLSCDCPHNNRVYFCPPQCGNSTCEGTPTAVCKGTYCGRCNEVFVDHQMKPVDCKNGKSGKCPAVPTNYIGSCDAECNTDSDCDNDLKCCSNGCGRVCISPRKIVKSGQCPPVTAHKKCHSWSDRCQRDDDCSGIAKCCSNGCRKMCQMPYTQQVKPGQCPFIKSKKHDSCHDVCLHDNDCSGKRKCCNLGCSRQCVIPHSIEKLGTCPASSTSMQCNALDRRVDECVMDADCMGVLKCCNTSCGRKCVSPFLHGKPGICPISLPASRSTFNCSHQCKDSKDCKGGDVCCVNGCDRVCWAPEVKDCVGKDGKLHFEGDLWHEDPCTLCQCLGGQATCVLRQCNDEIPPGCTADPVAEACCPAISCGGHAMLDFPNNRSCYDQTTNSVHADGELWHLDFCTECKCIAGHISCSTVTCPREVKSGCQLVKRPDRCCPEIVCKPTCVDHNGQARNNDDSWMEDPCTRCYCQNGRRLCKVKNCPPIGKKCHAYKVPGKCCPEVKCLPNEGHSCVEQMSTRFSGDIWIRDICSFCTCYNGAVKCFKEKCKSFNQTECYGTPLKRQCCNEVTCPMKEEGTCLFSGRRYFNNEIWHADICTICICKKGKVTCNVMACEQPRPGCMAEFIPGKCCSNIKCPHHVTGNLTCEDNGQIYPHGDTWYREPCKQCHCYSGRVTCTIRDCPSMPSHAGCHVSKLPGVCCPNVVCRKERLDCIDEDGLAFPHGTTFAKDPCTICKCEHGKMACVKSICPEVHRGCTAFHVEGQCCPNVVCPDKSGWCPESPRDSRKYPSNCTDECMVDADCPYNLKCCTIGCAQKCKPPVNLDCIDYKGIHRQIGDQWYKDSCTLCHCSKNNATECKSVVRRCPKARKNCDAIPLQNQCCSEIECELSGKTDCNYGNDTFADGDFWFEDECSSCSCRNGQVFCAQISCPSVPVGCRKVKKPGACCPEVICHESHSCNVHGHVYLDRESWHLDECTQCRCDHGQSWCTKRTCNTELLPGCYAVKLSGQCCPNVVCNSGTVTARKEACRTSGGLIYKHGEVWHTDPCTKCMCDKGHSVCNITSCPVIRGADCRAIPVPGQCCPNVHCREAKSCIHEGVKHLNGERWAISECGVCECVHGRSICEYTECSKVPDGCQAEEVPGQCCPNIRCPGTVYDPRSCRDFKGKIHHHGDRWTRNFGCTFCECWLGQITCRHRSCRPIPYRPGCYKIQYADMCCPDVICGKTKPGRCPVPDLRKKIASCVDECHADSDCPKEKKCCSSACARQCIKPIFRLPSISSSGSKPKKVKIGQCPVPLFGRNCVRSGHGCKTDQDCKYLKKCCFTGCNYDCMEPEISEVCTPEKPEVLCFEDPCQRAVCDDNPTAVCRPNRCGSCKAVFYDQEGNKVNCGDTALSGRAHSICPSVRDIQSKYQRCDKTCTGDEDCKNGSACCWNKCGRVCVPVLQTKLKVCNANTSNERPHGTIWKHSPCKTCSCVDGKTKCWRQTCTPVPPGCFAEPQIRECCPRVVCPYEMRCSDDTMNNIYKNESWSAGPCTTCRCNGVTPSCFAAVCRAPAFGWRAAKNPDQCCPDLIKQGCRDSMGHHHPEGDFWMPEPCLRCRCENGITKCQTKQCYSPGIGCYAIHRDGQCCPDIVCSTERNRCYRVRELKYGQNNPHAGLWPSCDDNGDFSPLQCNPPTGHCWCVNKWGIEHKGTRVQYMMPTCGYRPCFEDVHRRVLHLDKPNLGSVYIPQCDNDGKYNTQQCDPVSKECWCVEEDGTEIEGTRQIGKASCGCRDAFGVLRVHNEVFTYDSCKTCRCNQGNIACSVHSCPGTVPLGCKPVVLERHCCPRFHCGDKCVDVFGRVHYLGERWSVDQCQTCECTKDGIKCELQRCPKLVPRKGCYLIPSRTGCCPEMRCMGCGGSVAVADCLRHPCRHLKCPGYPNAVCRADFCGACKAEFVDPINNQRVDCRNQMAKSKQMRSSNSWKRVRSDSNTTWAQQKGLEP